MDLKIKLKLLLTLECNVGNFFLNFEIEKLIIDFVLNGHTIFLFRNRKRYRIKNWYTYGVIFSLPSEKFTIFFEPPEQQAEIYSQLLKIEINKISIKSI